MRVSVGSLTRFWRKVFSQQTNLRAAAHTIFALTGILPLGTLVTYLWRGGLLDDPQAQINVLLALVVALAGLVVFQSLMRVITSVAGSLQDGGVPAAGADAQSGVVVAVGRVGEIAEIADAFSKLLDDLRTSTDRLGDSVLKLGTLNEMSELAARVPALQDLLEIVLERTMRTVHGSIGSIMLIDRERKTLRVAASRGLADVEGLEIRVGEGIAGKVAQLGDAVVVDDIETDPRFARTSDPKYGGGSFMCVPIRARDEVIGVINVAKKQPGVAGAGPGGAFSSIDLHFLNALMTNVGYAVDNARMLEESRRSATELRQALEDVQAAQARLVHNETLRALGELASGMAHHLNNLLAVIVGRVDLLLATSPMAEQQSRLDSVRRAAMDAAEVVRRMLRFADRGQGVTQAGVDLNAIVSEAVELQRHRWHDAAQLRGTHIDVTVQPGELPEITADAPALREVMMSLLANAIEALPQGGGITMTTWATETAVLCTITDSGTGMSEALRARAIEPFFTTKGPRGTGLGLSASYGIIEQHGGELSIESVEGRGTSITIKLPVPRVPGRLSGGPIAPRPLRILLVDDEPEVRLAIGEMLMEDGHHVVEAASGPEALVRLERGERYDLVLTDLGMPEMTGWDVARGVKARWPKVLVGVITGWQESGRTDDDRRAVDLFVDKPVTFDALRAVIRDLPDTTIEGGG
jgi:signal transduction histidine kinase/CheY-like chemotaxis protein